MSELTDVPSYVDSADVADANDLSARVLLASAQPTGSVATTDSVAQEPLLDQVAAAATEASIINIDQAWLNARGVGPYYLDQQGSTYVLQTDVTTDGTAFAIIARDIVFDLNGHTITYDNAGPIAVPNGSFEAGSSAVASGWDFSTAPGASRYQGVWLQNEVYDGDYSLKFALPNSDQHITSTTTVTLEANTTYSLSAMFEYGGKGDTANPGVKGYVRLVGSGLTTREVSWNGTNWRGIQLQEGTFTTGATQETYYVQVGIEGGGALDPATAKPFYIDDLKIQRTKTYGVAISPKSWNPAEYPGISQYGSATNAIVKNGTIVQGADGATRAHGVYIYAETGVAVDSLNITVNGANSSAISGKDNFNQPVVISNSSLTSNVQTITSRDNFDGAVVKGLVGTFYNNTITNGPHAGFATGGNGSPSVYHGNTIQLKVRYTNAFAIVATASSQVYNNLINCGTGEYTARGITVAGGTALLPGRIYDNTIHVQELANNQEYEGANAYGAYGIQLENVSNMEVYGNDVYAHGDVHKAYAFRLNNYGGYVASNVSVHNNTFRAISNGARAATIKLDGATTDALAFVDNTLVTNDGIVGETTGSVLDLVRSHLIVSNPIATPHVFTAYYWPNQNLHTQLSLIDTTFADAAAEQYLASAIVKDYGAGNPDNRMAFSVKWTTTIKVNDANGAALPNANVTVTDTNGAPVFTGLSDANGQVVAVLTEFQTQGSTKTSYSPFTISTNFNGQQVQRQLTADQAQTISLQFDATELNNAPSGTDTTVTTSEDTAYTFSLADFGFSDPNDSPANSLLAVKITTLPTAGSLTNNGAAVSVGQFIALADITTGKLKFTPAVNAKGNGYAAFTFQVQDNGGTTGGGVDLDPTPNTITINVNGVNDAPAGADTTVTTNQNTDYTFATADFGFTDVNDSPANALLEVKVATLPSDGLLTNNGIAVSVGQLIAAADIAAGKFKFTPAANASGAPYASFSFQVQDNGGTSNGGIDLDPTPNSISIDVNSISTSLDGLWKFNEGTGTVASDSSGNNNQGTLLGGAKFGTGHAGAGLLLSGSNQRAVVADSPSLAFIDAITISAWISPAKKATQTVIRKGSASIDGFELGLSNSGKVFVRFNQASSGDSYRLNSTSSYPTNGSTWLHVVATYDGATIKLYINGTLQASAAKQFTLGTNNLALGIGAEAGGARYMKGRIDDVLLANRALSSTEVSALFNGTYPTDGTQNQAPVVNAGADQSGQPGAVITLNGSVSDDGLPASSLSAQWSVVSGPGVVNFANTNAAATTATFSAAGTYVLRLTASDGQLTASDELSVVISSTSQSADVTGLWKLDDGTGTVAGDSSGNNNHGTLQGGASFGAGHSGGGLVISGASQRVVVPDAPSLDFTTAITIAAWISPTSKATQTVIGKGNSSVDGYELALSNTGKVFVRFNQATASNAYRLDSTSSYPTNGSTWLHVAATYDGSSIKLYINGVLQVSSQAQFAIGTNNLDLGIGAEAGGDRSMKGRIDDVLVANRALTSTEVSALSSGSYPIAEPSAQPLAATLEQAHDSAIEQLSWDDAGA